MRKYSRNACNFFLFFLFFYKYYIINRIKIQIFAASCSCFFVDLNNYVKFVLLLMGKGQVVLLLLIAAYYRWFITREACNGNGISGVQLWKGGVASD